MNRQSFMVKRFSKLLLFLLILNVFRKISEELWLWVTIVQYEKTQALLATPRGDENDLAEIPPRPKNFRQYFRTVQEPIFLCGAQYGNHKPDNVNILVVVLSTPGAKKQRQGIRDTWIRRMFEKIPPARIIFSIGKLSRESDKDIAFENRIHNDILQTNVAESYETLPLKVLASFQWVADNCPNTKFVLKCDDDTFVNVDALRVFLDEKSNNFLAMPQTAIYGKCFSGAKPIRDMAVKWAVNKETYPAEVFPDFCSGTAYILTGDVPNKLVDAAYKYQGAYLHVEDVVFTGILAESLSIPRKNFPGFVHHWFPVEKVCRKGKRRNDVITVHRIKTPGGLKEFAGRCFNR